MIGILENAPELAPCDRHATIEHRGALDVPVAGHAFGCDICQEVCPWNQTPPPTPPAIAPRSE